MGKVLFFGFVVLGMLAVAWQILKKIVPLLKQARRGKMEKQLHALQQCHDSPDGFHHGPELSREEKPRVPGTYKQFTVFRRCNHCGRNYTTSKGGGWKRPGVSLWASKRRRGTTGTGSVH